MTLCWQISELIFCLTCKGNFTNTGSNCPCKHSGTKWRGQEVGEGQQWTYLLPVCSTVPVGGFVMLSRLWLVACAHLARIVHHFGIAQNDLQFGMERVSGILIFTCWPITSPCSWFLATNLSLLGYTTTIAGGLSSGHGRRDGLAQNATFSADFELVYVPKICALLVADRGNRMVRQINLKPEDCAHEKQSGKYWMDLQLALT